MAEEEKNQESGILDLVPRTLAGFSGGGGFLMGTLYLIVVWVIWFVLVIAVSAALPAVFNRFWMAAFGLSLLRCWRVRCGNGNMTHPDRVSGPKFQSNRLPVSTETIIEMIPGNATGKFEVSKLRADRVNFNPELESGASTPPIETVM